MIAIVVSREDSASEHIGEHLLALTDWEREPDDTRPDAGGGGTVYRTDGFELREFDDLHLSLEDAATAFDDPALLVFASRHSGETGPLLTAHHTGNFGPAEHGGTDRALARACPNAHDRVLDALAEYAPDGYDVGMECTHHGPTSVGAPSMFVEVGSAEPQWDDPDAARAVARAILDLHGVSPDRKPEAAESSRRHLVGFGGGHYAPRFGRIAQETDWAVGHVAADWCLDAMGDPAENHDVIEQAFERSAAGIAVLDGDLPALEAEVESLGYRVRSETWVRAVEGVPLALVDRLEDALVPVNDGLRFGDLAQDVSPDAAFVVTSLPDDLLAEARGIDRDRLRTVVETNTLAFETSDNGTRAEGRGAVTSRGDYQSLIESLLGVLRRECETVERREDERVVVARKSAFDPAKAAELGVPEGPKFGQLAAGESVSVDGDVVDPDQVESIRERRFSVQFNHPLQDRN
jgi:D-aminoacyl-tRNA deacylase